MSFAFRLGMALVAVFMLFATSRGNARVVHYEGECRLDGGNWIFVITIDDNSGKVTFRQGVRCDGVHWEDHCSVVPGGLGATSDYYIADVSPRPRWWIRINVDQFGNITGMWGENADGVKWVAGSDSDDDSLT